MSVINQMLRDLDARGQGDAVARRAAMASAGHPVGHRRPEWRSRRLWWLVAAVTVSLAVATVWLVLDRWRVLENLATADPESPATVIPQALVEAGAIAQNAAAVPLADPEPTMASTPVAPAVRPAALEPSETATPSAAPIPSATPLRTVESEPAAPVAAPAAASTPPSRTDPAPPAAPTARAVIERVGAAVDPLDAARTALAEGRADAALVVLAEQSTTGAERDALEAAALQQLGRHAEAEQAYRRALHREPDIGAWWAGLGIALDASGRSDEALAAFREAQRRGPLDPALADYLGERVEALSAGESPR